MKIRELIAVTIDGETYMREPHTGALVSSRPGPKPWEPKRLMPPMVWDRPKPLVMKAGA